MTAKQCLELLQSSPNNDSDVAQMENDESGSEADWVCEDESSSSSDSEEDASEVPGPISKFCQLVPSAPCPPPRRPSFTSCYLTESYSR
ncbi:UNVERIFIED_CONTAM: hypothetical protein FKN15_075777 [Acipenser sinensis]